MGSARRSRSDRRNAPRIPIVGIVIALVLGMVAAGCTSGGNGAGKKSGGDSTKIEGPLVVWADSQRAEALRPFAEKLKARGGPTLEIRAVDNGLETDLISATRNGGAPDLVMGDHTWLGNLLTAGAIEQVRLSASQKSAFNDVALRALTQNGQLYGVPYAFVNDVLYRNTDLAPDVPRTFEEAVSIGRQLQRAGRVRSAIAVPVGEGGDAYAAYPLFTSAGGYLFGTAQDGKADLSDLGLRKAEAATAFAKLSNLGEKSSGALTRSVAGSQALADFVSGATPYLVGDPSALAEIKRSGIKYDICAVPRLYDGQATQALVTVPAFYVASGGQHKEMAQRFVAKYLTEVELPETLYAGQSLPLALTAAFAKVDTYDSDMRKILDAGRDGLLVPAIPQISDILRSFAKVEVAAISGGDITTALATAVDEIAAKLN